MNNEQQQIIDEVYNNYRQENKHVMYLTFLLEEEFIRRIKHDTEFSEKWGLKIEERELTWDESNEYYNNHQSLKVPYLGLKVPNKIITITYNDKTIESYE
jgi:hypothetical protein